jgi:D-alanine-D-alanine ligase
MPIQVKADWWKTLFDQVYLLTDQRTVGNPELTKAEIDLLFDLLPIEPGHRILDLCGGHGRHSLELCSRGYSSLTLLDFSASLLDTAKGEAKRHDRRLNLVQADARTLPLSSNSFDHVLILGNSLGYGPDIASDRTILGQTHRVLRPGGSILLDVTDREAMLQSFTPSAWHEIGEDILVCRSRERNGSTVRARELVLSKERGLIRDQAYAIRLYEPSELLQLLAGSGFTNLKLHTKDSLGPKHGDCGFMNNRLLASGQKDMGQETV